MNDRQKAKERAKTLAAEYWGGHKDALQEIKAQAATWLRENKRQEVDGRGPVYTVKSPIPGGANWDPVDTDAVNVSNPLTIQAENEHTVRVRACSQYWRLRCTISRIDNVWRCTYDGYYPLLLDRRSKAYDFRTASLYACELMLTYVLTAVEGWASHPKAEADLHKAGLKHWKSKLAYAKESLERKKAGIKEREEEILAAEGALFFLQEVAAPLLKEKA